MNQISERDMQTHVNILGWLLIVSHALFLVIGAFVFILLTSVGAVSGDSEALAVLSIIGTGIAGLMALLGLPGILAGFGLLRRANWGRLLAIIIAILNLFNFPIGTIIGAYALFVLLQDAAGPYFRGHTASEPARGEVAIYTEPGQAPMPSSNIRVEEESHPTGGSSQQ